MVSVNREITSEEVEKEDKKESDHRKDNTLWGYYLRISGKNVFVVVPKLPLIRAKFTVPPFFVTKPDGRVVEIVEISKDKFDCLIQVP